MSSFDNILFKKMNQIADEKEIPLNGEFELTTRCNLNCIMCYTRKSPDNQVVISQELSKEEIIELARVARDAGMIYTLLTGGEIFLRPDFKEIYEAFTGLGLIITLYTNGTLITEEIADWLSKRPPYLISISVYGASAETYERITGFSNGFEKVINAIDYLLERNLNVEIKTTWLKGNIDDFEKLTDIANTRDIQLKIVNYVFPSIESECSDPIGSRLDPKLLASKWFAFEQKYDDENEWQNIDNLNVVNYDSAFDCACGKRYATFSWDGKLRSCSLITDIYVDANSKTFIDDFKKLNQKLRDIKRYAECDECKYLDACFPCPARRFIETGSYYEKPSYLCEYSHEKTLLKSKLD